MSSNSVTDESRMVAICQVEPLGSDIQSNVEKIIHWMEKAKRAGAVLAIFGELFLNDYSLENITSLSEVQDGPSFVAISSAAKKLEIAVIYGYGERGADGKVYNSAMFVDATGKRIANYRKTHIWPTETAYSPGNKTVVVNWGGLKVGFAICVDICMSEFVTSTVGNSGAQVIVCLAALVGGMTYAKTPKILVPARALENRCHVIYATTVGKKYLGASCVCDPHGEFIVSNLSGEERILMAKIPLETQESVPFHYLSLRRSDVYAKHANR